MINHYAISAVLTSLSSFIFGTFVFFRGREKKPNRLWFLFTASVGIYGWGAAWFSTEQNLEMSIYIWRMTYILGIIWIAPLFYHFVCVFCDLRRTTAVLLNYLTAAIFSLSSFSPLWWPEFRYLFGQLHYAQAGPIFALYFLWWSGLVFLSHVELWRHMKVTSGIKRNQIAHFFLASAIGYSGGSLAYLPMFGVNIYPYGTYCIPIYPIVMTYAILQYRLFDIHVVMRKSLVYSVLLTCLTVFYFACVMFLERLFQLQMGYRSIAVSAFAFVLLGFMFQPLKIGIQRFFDLVFFRAPQYAVARRMEQLESEAMKTEKLKAVATLAAGLCHELRNPMQVIQTHAEYLSDRSNEPRFIEQCSGIMREEIARISGLLKELMDFAKPKSPNFQWIEPRKVVESTLELLNNEFVSRQVDLEKRYGSQDIQIKGDPDQLRQVILNLVLNAVQAIGQGGRVVVATGQENGWFTLEVSDSGPGIDPAILPKLFEPFTSGKPGGTGLGLSIVHSIVREHRGEIAVQTKPGQGTIFTIKLPL